MRIVHHGKPPQPWWCGLYRCARCGGTFLVEPSDTVRIAHDPRPGEGSAACYPCPDCHAGVWKYASTHR